MILWIGMIITLLAWAFFSRRTLEIVLDGWAAFLALSLLNSICFNLIWYNPERLSDLQFCLDIVFISSILQQIWFGDFFIMYTAGAIVWTYSVFKGIHLLLSYTPYFAQDLPVEISFSLTNLLFGYALLSQIINRYRRKFYKNFRFWLISGITIYYSLGFIAFVVLYHTAHNINKDSMINFAAMIHNVGFSLAMIFSIIAMALSYRDTVGDEELHEVFLLPKWLHRKVIFWHVIRSKN